MTFSNTVVIRKRHSFETGLSALTTKNLKLATSVSIPPQGHPGRECRLRINLLLVWGTGDMLVLQSNSSCIFGGWSIGASMMVTWTALRLKRRDAHKTCALLWLLAGDI